MFLREDMPEFVDAVASVENEFSCTVDRARAFRIIQTVYNIREGKKGNAFRKLWDTAIKRHLITDAGELRKYQLIIGRYFNARSVNARKGHTAPAQEDTRPYPRVVGEPTATQVTLEMEIGMKVTFTGNRATGHLTWDDAFDLGTHPALLPGELHEAKRIALACMNDRRAAAP